MGVSLKIEFDSGNAAFEDDPVEETVRILRTIARQIESGRTGEQTVHDVNGNSIGEWFFEVEDEDEPEEEPEEDDDESTD